MGTSWCRERPGSRRHAVGIKQAAVGGGHFITIRSPIAAMPNIRGPRLAEFREDVVNATLLAILLSKGVVLEPGTAPWQPRNAVSRACGQRVRPPLCR